MPEATTLTWVILIAARETNVLRRCKLEHSTRQIRVTNFYTYLCLGLSNLFFPVFGLGVVKGKYFLTKDALHLWHRMDVHVLPCSTVRVTSAYTNFLILTASGQQKGNWISVYSRHDPAVTFGFFIPVLLCAGLTEIAVVTQLLCFAIGTWNDVLIEGIKHFFSWCYSWFQEISLVLFVRLMLEMVSSTDRNPFSRTRFDGSLIWLFEIGDHYLLFAFIWGLMVCVWAHDSLKKNEVKVRDFMPARC